MYSGKQPVWLNFIHGHDVQRLCAGATVSWVSGKARAHGGPVLDKVVKMATAQLELVTKGELQGPQSVQVFHLLHEPMSGASTMVMRMAFDLVTKVREPALQCCPVLAA